MTTRGRRLVMWNLQTLDGCFDGSRPWELDWHELVWGPELEQLSVEQLQGCGGLVFGRRTYEGMAAYWSSATGPVAELMNALPKLVFTRTLERAGWSGSHLVRGRAEDELERLKAEPGKDLFLFGSAELADTFTRYGLVDEYRICLVPKVLGSGRPLWKPGAEGLTLRLLEARSVGSGGVILRYAPAPPAPRKP